MGGLEHLRQSVRDILTTPIGSRVMRREYGSACHELLDANLDAYALGQLYATVVASLDRWEPRLRVTRVQAEALSTERVTIALEGEYFPEGREIRLEGLVL